MDGERVQEEQDAFGGQMKPMLSWRPMVLTILSEHTNCLIRMLGIMSTMTRNAIPFGMLLIIVGDVEIRLLLGILVRIWRLSSLFLNKKVLKGKII